MGLGCVELGMFKMAVLVFVPVLVLGEGLPSAKPVPRVQAVPKPHHVTSFQLEGRELTAIHYDPADYRVFWYPIMSAKGVCLTRMGHPHDPLTHSHHNSVWISHSNVNGLDFWGDQRKQNQGRILAVEVSRDGYMDSDEAAGMRMVNHWVAEADRRVQMIEVRRTEVRPLDGVRSWLMIVDLDFSAPKGQTAVINPSFFGLIAVRMAKSIGVLDGGGRILNSAGQMNEAEVFRQPAEWVDYSGRITNEVDGFAGITLMNHPMNPENPTAFHVRDDGWMGASLVPDVLAEKGDPKGPPLKPASPPIEVTEAKHLRLRYALWVHDGIHEKPAIQRVYEIFTALPAADLFPTPPMKTK